MGSKIKISELERMFHVLYDAKRKGITFVLEIDTVVVDFYDSRTGKVEHREFSYQEAAIFFKDILETY